MGMAEDGDTFSWRGLRIDRGATIAAPGTPWNGGQPIAHGSVGTG